MYTKHTVVNTFLMGKHTRLSDSDDDTVVRKRPRTEARQRLPSGATTAVLVRTYDPSRAAVERLLDWANELKVAEELNVDLWISIDVTLRRPGSDGKQTAADGKKRKRLRCGATHENHFDGSVKDYISKQALQRNLDVGKDIHVCEYTEADMLRLYPSLSVCAEKPAYVNSKIKKRGRCSLAWGFHVEAINYWFHTQPLQQYTFVWVVEDDVGFSGDFAGFISSYSSNEEDLIYDTKTPVADSWYWRDVHSPYFSASFTGRLVASEHVQRFSKKLLDCLHTLGKTHECHAWSESLVPTIACHEPYKFKTYSMRKKNHVGSIFQWDGRVTEQMWRRIVTGYSLRQKNKLYHALKW